MREWLSANEGADRWPIRVFAVNSRTAGDRDIRLLGRRLVVRFERGEERYAGGRTASVATALA